MGFLASAPPHRAEAEPRALAWPPSDCRVAPPNLQVAQHKFVDDNSPKLVRDLPAWTDGKFRRKLVKWTCLCECFPYRMSLLVLIVNDFEQKGQVNQAAGCARTRLGADDKVDRCEAALRDARACVDAHPTTEVRVVGFDRLVSPKGVEAELLETEARLNALLHAGGAAAALLLCTPELAQRESHTDAAVELNKHIVKLREAKYNLEKQGRELEREVAKAEAAHALAKRNRDYWKYYDVERGEQRSSNAATETLAGGTIISSVFFEHVCVRQAFA